MSTTELIEATPTPVAAHQPANNPYALVALAIEKGASIEQLGQLMALQERHEANEARKAYNAAFSAFKAEAVRIVKNRGVTAGPLSGKKYAELFAVVNAVTPALSKHGLSAAWKITKDEPQWIEVTCILTHEAGHSERVSMGGPPDAGGAKNKIQERASTVSYLERYTLKAICGLSEQDDDTDGQQGLNELLATWTERAEAATTVAALSQVHTQGGAAFTKARDVPGYAEFGRVVARCKAALKAAA